MSDSHIRPFAAAGKLVCGSDRISLPRTFFLVTFTAMIITTIRSAWRWYSGESDSEPFWRIIDSVEAVLDIIVTALLFIILRSEKPKPSPDYRLSY